MNNKISLQKNQFTIEKVVCKQMPNTVVSAVFCEIKYIRHGLFRMNFWTNLSEPVHDIWAHLVFYYRYSPTSYQKWAIDVWENVCDWLGGKKSPLLDWTARIILKYSNANNSCPYEGYVQLKADNLSVNSVWTASSIGPISNWCHCHGWQ